MNSRPGEEAQNIMSANKDDSSELLLEDWEKACEHNSESSNNTSPTNLCCNASVPFSHSDLKAQLGKWEYLRSVWMQ